MNYKPISEPHNTQAVALFREHLPPHIADICIEAHVESVKKSDIWLKMRNGKPTLRSALSDCINLEHHQIASSVFDFVSSNTFHIEAFYTEFPDLRPTETQEVTPRFTVKIIDCQTNEAKQTFQTDRMVEAVSKFNELLELCGISEYSEFNNHLAGISQDGLLVILMEK